MHFFLFRMCLLWTVFLSANEGQAFPGGIKSSVIRVKRFGGAPSPVKPVRKRRSIKPFSWFFFSNSSEALIGTVNLFTNYVFQPDGSHKSSPASPIPCGEQAPGYEPDIGPSSMLRVSIVGGSTAKAHSWPWQVAIIRYNVLIRQYEVWCGGAILSDRWIATASHCLSRKRGIIPPYDSLYLKVGAQDHGNFTPNEPTQQVVRIDKAFKHPLFSAASLSHDIALFKSITKMTFNDYVRPVCLPSSADVIEAGSHVVITGWGDLIAGIRKRPHLLRQVVVPVISHATCSQDYEDIDDTMFCAGFQTKGGHDACQGDSGGPLIQKRSDGKWYLEGIVSFGRSCAMPGYPGVYHRVASTVDWIIKVMSEN